MNCSVAGQVPQYNGGAWTCVQLPVVTPESDPVWTTASASYYTKTYITGHYYDKTTLDSTVLHSLFFSPSTNSCTAGQVPQYN